MWSVSMPLYAYSKSHHHVCTNNYISLKQPSNVQYCFLEGICLCQTTNIGSSPPGLQVWEKFVVSLIETNPQKSWQLVPVLYLMICLFVSHVSFTRLCANDILLFHIKHIAHIVLKIPMHFFLLLSKLSFQPPSQPLLLPPPLLLWLHLPFIFKRVFWELNLKF